MRPGGLELTLRGLEHCRLASGSRILDVGAGLGATVTALRDRGFDAVGVEPDAVLRRRAAAAHPGLPLSDACAAAVPWPDGSFAAVFAECVLSLVEADGALTEIRRVLRPGGALVKSAIGGDAAAVRFDDAGHHAGALMLLVGPLQQQLPDVEIRWKFEIRRWLGQGGRLQRGGGETDEEELTNHDSLSKESNSSICP